MKVLFKLRVAAIKSIKVSPRAFSARKNGTCPEFVQDISDFADIFRAIYYVIYSKLCANGISNIVELYVHLKWTLELHLLDIYSYDAMCQRLQYKRNLLRADRYIHARLHVYKQIKIQNVYYIYICTRIHLSLAEPRPPTMRGLLSLFIHADIFR